MPTNSVKKCYYTVIAGDYKGKKVWGFGFSPFDDTAVVYDDDYEYVIHDPVTKLRIDKEEVIEFSPKQIEMINDALSGNSLIDPDAFCEDQ